jgi:RNA polymerase-binding transcription factor DksA
MSKKPAPKKPAAKAVAKPVAKPVAKAKPPLKPVKKPVAKVAPPSSKKTALPTKPTAKVTPPSKTPPAKAVKAAGKAAAKPAPVAVPAKGAKAPVVAAKSAKPAKGAKVQAKTKAEHEKQKQLLDKHRGMHDQVGTPDAPVRTKLQFFTFADVLEHMKGRKREGAKLNLWVPEEERKAREKAATAAREKGHKSHNIAAASIADLLGGVNPFRKGGGMIDESKQIPEKLRRFYHLLTAMREVIQKGLAFHSEEALKKNGKDDAGDLSGYSQHLADAGTDTADRDFALSLISNEQEALKEIADAVERLKSGKYGICEITNKVIPHARLMAVPFTRYSLEGQKELERNRRAHRRRGGSPLGEIGDEVGFGTGGGGGEDDQPET